MQYKTRRYFAWILSVYFFGLAVMCLHWVLPLNGKPTAVHFVVSGLCCVVAVVCFLIGLRPVIVVMDRIKK
jgi:hypothetical protein